MGPGSSISAEALPLFDVGPFRGAFFTSSLLGSGFGVVLKSFRDAFFGIPIGG